MSFQVRKTKYRAWPVTIKQSVCDDAGVVTDIESTFVALFAPFTEQQIDDLAEEAKKAFPAPKVVIPANDGTGEVLTTEGEGPVTTALNLKRNALVFGRVIVGWGLEVIDENKQPIPFSVEELASMVTGPDGRAVSVGLNRAMLELRYGIAREKNSPASPAPGENSMTDGAPMSLPMTLPSSE